MDPETWMSLNTFYCDALHARITPQQCEANRYQANEKKKFSSYEKKGPVQCTKCEQWQEKIEALNTLRQEAEAAA